MINQLSLVHDIRELICSLGVANYGQPNSTPSGAVLAPFFMSVRKTIYYKGLVCRNNCKVPWFRGFCYPARCYEYLHGITMS